MHVLDSKAVWLPMDASIYTLFTFLIIFCLRCVLHAVLQCLFYSIQYVHYSCNAMLIHFITLDIWGVCFWYLPSSFFFVPTDPQIFHDLLYFSHCGEHFWGSIFDISQCRRVITVITQTLCHHTLVRLTAPLSSRCPTENLNTFQLLTRFWNSRNKITCQRNDDQTPGNKYWWLPPVWKF